MRRRRSLLPVVILVGTASVACASGDLCSVEPYACEDTGAETGDTDTAASAR